MTKVKGLPLTNTGILSFGGYIPRRRLQRAEIAKAHRWYNAGLGRWARGERAIANWDEDSITMAVEAARECLKQVDTQDVSGVWMASTRFPFLDRQNAGILAEALQLRGSFTTLDISSSQRAGTSGLMTALSASAQNPILLAAAEKRRAKGASASEMTIGDGAAAFLVGSGPVIARYMGGCTHPVDFIDHFRGEDTSFDYVWEERWTRDEGFMKIVPASVKKLIEQTGVDPSSINTFCFPLGDTRTAASIAKRVGLPETSVADNLQGSCGDTGSAHPLVMLAKALETARPGDRILVTGFGQGCDALLFEATNALADRRPPLGISGHLERRTPESNYLRYLSHNDLITIDRGFRAEVDKPTSLTTHYRNRETAQSMVGGRCNKCGTVQFPRSNICVAPKCGAIGTQEPYPFADRTGRLISFTADSLTFTPDPPSYYGLVQFDGGGRLLCDLSDIDSVDDVHVGMPVRMVFRVKDYDTRRDFRRYFWKAVPVELAAAGHQET